MSGGAYDYLCYRVQETYIGEMYDIELDDMMKDLCKVLHDLEWWQSGDISEEDYRKRVSEFKKKWFSGNRTGIKKHYVDIILSETKKKLYQVLVDDKESN